MTRTNGDIAQPTELFVRSPDVDRMRDPLLADWNVQRGAPIASLESSAAPIDFSLMDTIFTNFLDVVGLPIAIIDLDGRVLASSKWQRLCMDFHRINPDTLARCLESDRSLSHRIQEGKDYALHRCPNGLTDCAAPIVVEGAHVANLFVGQFLTLPPNLDDFRRQCRQFGFDEAAYLQALAEVPIIAEHKLPAILKLMSGLAQQIARQQVAERRALAACAGVERLVAERTHQLRESHERLRHIAARVPGVVYQFRRHDDGRVSFPYASEALHEMFGVLPEDVREDGALLFEAIHPDDRDALHASIRQSAATLDLWRYDFRTRDRQGRIRWVHGEAIPQRDAAAAAVLWHGFASDVTDRMRMAQEREQYFRFFRISIDPMCIADPFGCFKQVNPAFTLLTGFEESELVAKPFLEFIAPEDRQRTADEMKLQVAERPSLHFENRYVCKDGRRILLSWTAYFDKGDGVTYATARDITAIRQAEDALQEKTALLENVLGSSTDYIFVKDRQLRTILCNEAFAHALGKSPAEMYGKTDIENGWDADMVLGCPEKGIRGFEQDDRAVLGGMTVHSTTDAGNVGGGVRFFDTIKVPYRDASGNVIGLIGISRDITERNRSEQALRENTELLTQSNADLEQFAYVASHDLQTPLRNMVSYAQLLEHRYKGRIDADADDFIGFIVDSGRRMTHLITDLLEYSRITSRSKPPYPMSCAEAVAEALSNLQPNLDRAGAEVIVGDLPQVIAERSHLVSLFQNLLGNGLKYRAADRTPWLSVTAERVAPDRWRFAVADNGIGIERQYFEKIFEIFQRLDPSSDTEGTGIGLALCRRIVHRFGGTIWVDSTPGAGTTFFFTLRDGGAAG